MNNRNEPCIIRQIEAEEKGRLRLIKMESPPPISLYMSQNSKKREFSGTSSTCMEDADVVEIPAPVNWSSKSKSLKGKEVLCPEIIDLDNYEDWPTLTHVSGEADASHKEKHAHSPMFKQTFADHSLRSSAGTPYYAVGNALKSSGKSDIEISHHVHETYDDVIYVEDGDSGLFDDHLYVDQYALLQSQFDEWDIPPGIEVSVPCFMDDKVKEIVPWFMDDKGNETELFLESASTLSASQSQSNPAGFSSLNVQSPSPWCLETKNGNAKYTSEEILYPHSKYETKKLKPSVGWSFPGCHLPDKPAVSGVVQSNSSYDSAKNSKTGGLQATSDRKGKSKAPSEEVQHWSKHQFLTIADNDPQMPTGTGSYNSQGLGAKGGMKSVVDSNYGAWIPSIMSGSSNLSAFTGFPTAFSSWSPVNLESQKDVTVSNSFGPSSNKMAYGNPEVNTKKFDLSKRFDTVEDHSDHLFCTKTASVNLPSKSWSRKIQDEWKILEKDLPETIFVRVYESRMDLLRAVIIGAEGTPYHDGLFFFDMFFPTSYPNVPPHVKYHSGGLRINPNLYDCGKVCLSLLNTWSGSQKEMWIPGTSTVLQVLVSIQGLILNVKPYFNEPGYASTRGTVRGERLSQQYNETTFLYSLKTMVYSIRKPPKHFEDLVAGHFLKHAHDILEACKAYLNGALVGSFVKGAPGKVDKSSKGNSQKFTMELRGYMKTVIEAFAQIGVKDCEKFLS